MMIDEKYISKKDLTIIRMVFGIPFAFFLGFMVYSFLNRGDVIETKKQNDLEKAFEGRIDNLYRDRRNHNVETAILDNGYRYTIPYSWEGLFKVGDSLSKKKNSLKLEIYRSAQTKLALDYEDTYK